MTTHFQTLDGKGFNHNNTAPAPLNTKAFPLHNNLPQFVTAVELAEELGLRPQLFRKWLRKCEELPETVGKGWVWNLGDKWKVVNAVTQ